MRFILKLLKHILPRHFYLSVRAGYETYTLLSSQVPTHSIAHSFALIPATLTIEKYSYRAFNNLLRTVFGAIGAKYMLHPQYAISIDFVTTITITAQDCPVFFVEIKPPGDANSAPKRFAADEQMRKRFFQLRSTTRVPILYGMSGMGRNVCFYEMETATGRISPVVGSANWNVDVTSQAGWKRLMTVVHHIDDMVDASQ